MTEKIEQRVIGVIQDALRAKQGTDAIVVTVDDSMETVSAWDSLSFMSVFMAINEAFSVDPDFDDAIHYTSVKSLCAYLREHVA
jgi:acyl carrier protein